MARYLEPMSGLMNRITAKLLGLPYPPNRGDVYWTLCSRQRFNHNVTCLVMFIGKISPKRNRKVIWPQWSGVFTHVNSVSGAVKNSMATVAKLYDYASSFPCPKFPIIRFWAIQPLAVIRGNGRFPTGFHQVHSFAKMHSHSGCKSNYPPSTLQMAKLCLWDSSQVL